MTSGPDRLQDERHNQNLRKFDVIETDLRKNTEQTAQSLREVSTVRHDLKNLKDTVQTFFDMYREEKKERKIEMNEQAAELRKLSNRFIWITGAIAGFSVAAHFLFDLISPVTRHIFH